MAGIGEAHLRADSLLRVRNLVVEFPGRAGRAVQAVSGVSFDVAEGETLGLVGESGCGKSTTGKAIMQVPRPTAGEVVFAGEDLTRLKDEALRLRRPGLQMIHQDPISSLNPRRRIGEIVGEPLRIWSQGDEQTRAARVRDMLDAVGLDPGSTVTRRPHQFSGGQCQRISIARALMLEPRVLICDEAVSALDVSVQAQILNLLEDLKARHQLTMIFIAHDLAVVKNVSDRVGVMYLGRMCEVGPADRIYATPAHPYTAALLSAIPIPDPMAEVHSSGGISGELPSPMDPPSGCRFRTRCPQAHARCSSEVPVMREIGHDHFVACHRPLLGTEAPADQGVPVDVSPH